MRRILFVCVENSCRSQMAEGFARKLGRNVLEVYSAGSQPSGKVDPLAVKVMDEAGIDISKNSSKGFGALPTKEFDYAIILGCGDICPFVPAKKHVEWRIENPKGKDLESFRRVRGQIKDRVRRFIEEVSKEK